MNFYFLDKKFAFDTNSVGLIVLFDVELDLEFSFR